MSARPRPPQPHRAALRAPGFAEEAVRARARHGPAEAFPPVEDYGTVLHGGPVVAPGRPDLLDAARLVPRVFMPERLERLIELGREPTYRDVELTTTVGGFTSALPLYVSAFGSTRAAADLGLAVARQAGALGVPLVVGENVVPMGGGGDGLLERIAAYEAVVPDGIGGVAVQQSTEDADAEVWNLLYSHPATEGLLASGRLAFELKVGQGAKPGLGGATVVDDATAGRIAEQFLVDRLGPAGPALRSSSPGTFTEEILRQQIRLMRNNFPRARTWVKLHPGRDVAAAAALAWAAGADAVTVDGAEGGTGWAPHAHLQRVGLPLGECLLRIGAAGACPPTTSCLLASGRMWEGGRATVALALGAAAVGLGRAALVAADEDPDAGLVRLADCLALELRMLISSLGKYRPAALDADDVLLPGAPTAPARARIPQR